MKNLSSHLGQHGHTPQSQPIPFREHEMQKNAADGYVFKADDWERLDRFLIMGTEGGTYYTGERALTLDNAQVVRRCLDADPVRTICIIADVSDAGRAPKNDPAIFALAIAFAQLRGGKGAMVHEVDRATLTADLRGALVRVCRTGTHLFQFLQAVTRLRGGGRMLNGAVRYWIESHGNDELAYQMVKYRQRAGWTWRDVFRRFRPKPPTTSGWQAEQPSKEAHEAAMQRRRLYAWAAGKLEQSEKAEGQGFRLPNAVVNFNAAQAASEPGQLGGLILRERLPWEAVPTDQLNDPTVLTALLEHMPVMATVRNLPRLAATGVLDDPRALHTVLTRLRDARRIEQSRIHPVALMIAQHYYEQGANRNYKWVPNPDIVDALDDAFHLAFKNVEAPGETRRVLLAVDVSGSMDNKTQDGIPLYKAAAAMAMPYVACAELETMVVAFDMGNHDYYGAPRVRAGESPIRHVPLSPRMRCVDAERAIGANSRNWGTDCSLPFRFALEIGVPFDAIIVFTDNETWAGNRHPAEVLQQYRAQVNAKTRVVWCAMTATGSSLGLPDDGLTMGVAGFDAAAPRIVQDFLKGGRASAR